MKKNILNSQLVNINGHVKTCRFSAFFKDQYFEIAAMKEGKYYRRKTLTLPNSLLNTRIPDTICLTIDGMNKDLYLHWVDLKDVLINVQNEIFFGQTVIVKKQLGNTEVTYKLTFLPANHKEIEIVSAIKVDGCLLQDPNVSTDAIKFAANMGIWDNEENEPKVFHSHSDALYKSLELQQLLGDSSIVTAHRVVNTNGEYGYAN